MLCLHNVCIDFLIYNKIYMGYFSFWVVLEWALEFFQRNVLLHLFIVSYLTVKTLDKEQKVQVKSSSRVSVHSQMKKLLFRRSMRSINVIGMSLTTYVDWCWLASVVNLQLYFVQLVMIGGWFVEVLITDFVPTHATFWV